MRSVLPQASCSPADPADVPQAVRVERLRGSVKETRRPGTAAQLTLPLVVSSLL